MDGMFSHVMIGTNDLDRAKAFYDALLGTLDVPAGFVDRYRVFWRTPAGVFSVTRPIDGQPATVANGGTIGFACTSAEQVDAWHAAGLAHGGTTCEDPPGVREGPAGRLYLAYLRDPDGHKLCGLFRMPRS
jgi:catechol 2,3-dioxygenase-like lactoylglutathione lyase family enzyme